MAKRSWQPLCVIAVLLLFAALFTVVGQAELQVDSAPFGSWHVRRWAEQAYTPIHGPRR